MSLNRVMRNAFLLTLLLPAYSRAADPPRGRARELGLIVGVRPTGKLNAITDVAGVRVGHRTLDQGRARTGVTAIFPHGGDLWREKVPAAVSVLNGNGELTGAHWIGTQGALEVPIVLTNTMSVGAAMDGVIRWLLAKYPRIGLSEDVAIPTVAECDDSTLNDARALLVSSADVAAALDSAAEGPVAEGAVGAGTGMMAFDFKGGIGTSSRVLSKEEGGWTVGALVNANMAKREDLLIGGVPVGRKLKDLMPKVHQEGSIIVVLATDAPLDHLRLSRLASRASLGLARTGATSHHGSGDLFLAFSTGNRIPRAPKGMTIPLAVVADGNLDPLFDGAQEAVEEAILNSLTAARTTEGRDGNVAYALPIDRLKTLLREP
ncbi:MAG: P1 family peptidase [Elusimicrobia bacterium]|nr:P1 family peptidase [Elusimicrobiota bacterium]